MISEPVTRFSRTMSADGIPLRIVRCMYDMPEFEGDCEIVIVPNGYANLTNMPSEVAIFLHTLDGEAKTIRRAAITLSIGQALALSWQIAAAVQHQRRPEYLNESE